MTFVITVISPLLPIIAIVLFYRIGDALPLLISCLIILIVVLWSITALIRLDEKSPGLKIIGTVMGSLGLVMTIVIGFISGWSYTKM